MVPNQTNDLTRHKQCEPTVCDVYSTRQMPHISSPHFFDIKAIALVVQLLQEQQQLIKVYLQVKINLKIINIVERAKAIADKRSIENRPSDEYSIGLLQDAEKKQREAFCTEKPSYHPHIAAQLINRSCETFVSSKLQPPLLKSRNISSMSNLFFISGDR